MENALKVDTFPFEERSGFLPAIVDIKYSLEKYTPPLQRFIGVYKIALYSSAVEFKIRTNFEIPIQATSPAIYIGNIPVVDFDQSEPLNYTFRLFDYENLPDEASIYWGWSYEPNNKFKTPFLFNKTLLFKI